METVAADHIDRINMPHPNIVKIWRIPRIMCKKRGNTTASSPISSTSPCSYILDGVKLTKWILAKW